MQQIDQLNTIIIESARVELPLSIQQVGDRSKPIGGGQALLRIERRGPGFESRGGDLPALGFIASTVAEIDRRCANVGGEPVSVWERSWRADFGKVLLADLIDLATHQLNLFFRTFRHFANAAKALIHHVRVRQLTANRDQNAGDERLQEFHVLEASRDTSKPISVRLMS